MKLTSVVFYVYNKLSWIVTEQTEELKSLPINLLRSNVKPRQVIHVAYIILCRIKTETVQCITQHLEMKLKSFKS